MNKRKAIANAVKTALFATSAVGLLANPLWAAEEEEQEGQKVTVIGSKIRTDEQNDTVPVEVIMADEALDRGFVSVGQLLRQSTLASGSSQVTAATSNEFVQDGGLGAQTLSLRGLGANRTLVLLNGRRAGPAGTRGSVSSFDFNTLPLAAVERIEILKDGASSLYGSDAVAGVINIITKDGDGGAVDVFTAQPADEGGEQYRVSGSWGKSFSAGSFRVTADFNRQDELRRGDRDFFACGERFYFNQDGSRADIIDPRTGKPQCIDLLWGHVWMYDYGADNADVDTFNLAQYDYAGDLASYIANGYVPTVGPADDIFDIVMPAGWFLTNGTTPVVNGDHPFQDRESLIPKVTTKTVMADGDIELGDTARLYSELLLNRREVKSQGYRQYWGYVYNANSPFFASNPLNAGWEGAQWMSPTAITDHDFDTNTVDYSRFVLGIDGELGEWFYDFSLQRSHSSASYTSAVIYDDAISDQNWLSGSCAGTTSSVRGVDCVDIPWLDPQLLAGNITDQALRDYLFGVDTGTTLYDQTTVEGLFTGDLFEMPHGYVGSAFGFQYQRDQIKDTPSDTVLAGNAWGASSAGITQGAIEQYSLYGELKLPVLRDLPGAERVDVSLSARYTDAPEISSETTYKIGLAWEFGGGFTLRGSKGTSFRAPALFELFLANETGFLRQSNVDPCFDWADELAQGNITQTVADNCAADGIAPDHTPSISATTLRGGGYGQLEAETSDAQTWGIIWRPDFIDMSVSIDYFDFLIEGEVATLSAASIVGRCYSSETFPNDPFCDLFERRDADDGIDNINQKFINVARQTNKGYDFRFDITTELPFGELFIETEHTIQDEATRLSLPGSPVSDLNGRIGDPKHTANLTVRFTRNDWSVTWFTNFIGKADNYDVPGEQSEFTFVGENSSNPRDVSLVLDAGGTSYHTLSFTHTNIADGLELTAGVRNMFDKTPPQISGGATTQRIGTAAFYSQYDFIGRSYFANLSYKF
ncbi:TonB-dependent receptor domain-containing protein [Pleionea sediminis]|uniref:TonB-dependent receptor domain-containing protein n=1 Tax=Pleionea sediminis TaxID=2569479 RepID=UPI0011869AAD|nr:TonB-dependent receptor [Pleionea sediminis]